jgi:hypothetical protein
MWQRKPAIAVHPSDKLLGDQDRVVDNGETIATASDFLSHAQAASASGFGGSPSISPATFSGLVASPSRVDVQHPAVSRDPRTPGGTMPGTPVTALPVASVKAQLARLSSFRTQLAHGDLVIIGVVEVSTSPSVDQPKPSNYFQVHQHSGAHAVQFAGMQCMPPTGIGLLFKFWRRRR